jgi:MFS family permease
MTSATASSRINSLRDAPREYWLVLATKAVAITAYGVMNSTLVLYLSADLGFDDKQAGLIIAMWSALLSLATVFVGSFVDVIGVRRAVLTGLTVCLFARGLMTFASNAMVVITLGILPLAFGEALLTPVMVAAVKQYTRTEQRTLAFALFYTMMNLGFATAGLMFDALRVNFGEHGHVLLPVLHIELSTYRLLFFCSWLLTLPALALVYFGLRDGPQSPVARSPSDKRDVPEVHETLTILTQTRQRFSAAWRTPGFFRYLLLLSLMVGVRLVFYHMYYTFPKYALRELGEGAPIGRLFGVLNAVIVIILTPVVGLLTQGRNTYSIMILGTLLSAGAIFILAIPPELFSGLATTKMGHLIAEAWLGLSAPATPIYFAILCSVIILSVGETLWSPRLYEYSAEVAPKGQEATYMSMSILPLFVAKLGAGAMSGWLLDAYCPASGPRDSATLWLIVGCMAALTPLGLGLFKRHIRH